jgi:prolyl 4-hydroxylase
MKFFSYYFGINFLTLSISCEFYSSTDKLHELFHNEVELLENIVDVIEQIDDFRDFLSKKHSLWYEEHIAAQNNVEKYVTNPLSAYLLIKRSFYDVKQLQEQLTSFIAYLQLKVHIFEENCLKEKKEVTGAVTGIIRAQRAYHLKTEDLVEGIVEDVRTREPLSTHDIYVLGIEALEIPKGHYFAKSFLNIVAKKLKNEEDVVNEVNGDEVNEFLKKLELEDISDPFDESYTINEVRSRKTEDILVHQVCRGNLTRLSNETKNLQCRFVSFSFFSTIAPFKLEEMNLEPYIVLYHEIISEEEIETLLELSRPYQEKANVGFEEKRIEANDDDRLAQVAWLYDDDDDDEVVDHLNSRFEDMTGLSMETAEALQVQNYGIGGLIS